MSLMAQAVPAPSVQPIARGGLVQRCGGISCPPGTCNHTDDPADATVQRSANVTAAAAGSGVPASVLRVLDTVGTPLDASTRTNMEARLGHDFGHVRVHTDAEAARSAKSIQAQAYTFGSHVVMGEGRFQPHTPAGVRLLAHELTHVVQQIGVSAPARSVSDPDDFSEREAERAADFMSASRMTPAPPDRVHRTTDEQTQLSLDQSTDDLFGGQYIGGGGESGGGGSSGSFDEAPPGGASVSRPSPMICSRPIAVPGLGAFGHAFVNDPPAELRYPRAPLQRERHFRLREHHGCIRAPRRSSHLYLQALPAPTRPDPRRPVELPAERSSRLCESRHLPEPARPRRWVELGPEQQQLRGCHGALLRQLRPVGSRQATWLEPFAGQTVPEYHPLRVTRRWQRARCPGGTGRWRCPRVGRSC